MKEFKVENHVSSMVPEGFEWKLVWNDEFDGKELDRTKWDYRLYLWGERYRTFTDEGLYLDGNSNVVFKVIEKDGEICSQHLQTGYNWIDNPREENDLRFFGGLEWPLGKFKEHKFLHKYGYYECRCKLQKKPGWWSAFWLQSPVIGSSADPGFSGIENDIMESFEPGKIIRHNNHYNGYGADHKVADAGKGMNLSLDEYHTFGMLWDENGYVFYVDGIEDGRITEPVSHIPQYILISTEVNGYRKPEHAPTEEAKLAVGDEFVVDYVRVFDKVNG